MITFDLRNTTISDSKTVKAIAVCGSLLALVTGFGIAAVAIIIRTDWTDSE
jgi:hypothetical protein